MRKLRLPDPSRIPLLGTSAILVVLVVAIDAVAVYGIFAARQGAEQAALTDLELQAEADARALEAVLATIRGDLALLSRSAPLATALERRESPDPMSRRWARLDVESALLLFLDAHPGVSRLEVRGAGGEAVARAGYRSGAPTLLPPGADGEDEMAGPVYVTSWRIGEEPPAEGSIRVWLVAWSLLERIGRPAEEGLELELAAGEGADGEGLEARAPVRDPRWDPPIDWTLVRREEESHQLASVEALSGRYRTTLLLNFAVIALALVLGNLAFAEARRAARMEAEREHESRLREVERQLLHSERLAAMGRLASGIAHEINNPLAGIANHLELLDGDLAAGRAEEASGRVERARYGVERAATITRRMLSLAARGDGRREERFAVDRVASEAAEFLRSSGSFPGVEIEVRRSPERLEVEGDPTALGQLFLNLLLNACEIQEGGGEVIISVAREGDRVRSTVADRGPGVPRRMRDRLFEPFESGRGSSGLGLSICRRIAEEHGGTIDARPRRGGGTVFEVDLPAADGGGEGRGWSGVLT